MSTQIQALQAKLTQLRAALTPNPTDLIDTLLNLVEAVKNQDPSYSLQLSQEAYNLSLNLPDSLAQARSLHYLCEASRRLGKMPDALAYGQDGLQKARLLTDPHLLINQLLEMAKIYATLEDNPTALSYVLEAFSLSETHALPTEQARVLNAMGVLYSKQGQLKQEQASYLQAIALYEQLNDSDGLAIMYNNLAMCYTSQGNHKTALLKAQQALELVDRDHFPEIYITILCTLGEINVTLQLYQQGQNYLSQALSLADALHFTQVKIEALLILGHSYLAQKQVQQAKTHLLKALHWAEESQNITSQAEAHDLLAQTFELAGHFPQALSHYKDYHRITASIFNTEADLRLKNLQVLHQTEIAQRQAQLMQSQNQALQHEITIRQKAEAKAQSLAQQMTTLSQINREISATLNLQQVLEKIVNLVNPALKASDVGVYVAPPGSHTFTARAVSGMYETEMQAHRFEEGVGLLGQIAQSGHAEYINRPSQDPRTRKLPGSWDETVGSDDDLYPLMAAPFHLEDGSRGVICLWRHVKQGFFDDNDLEFLRGLAHQTAVAFTNAQLYTQAKLAQKSAEASNRAKDNFLATMSHEFRTPLNAILGYAQLMQRTPHFPEHHREGLNAILHSGQHLLALITDMLDLAKVEAGKMELTPNAFFLPDLLNVTAKIVHVWATDKKLTFHLQNDTNLTMLLYGDRRRLQQVLLNLINNAIKFTPHGHITLRVDLVSLTPFKPALRQPNLPIDPIGEAELQFEVQDTGIGIAAEDLAKIFTPFEQGRPYNRPQEGTGLGLAISQSLLDLMGSAIQVDSTPGKGSTFSFRLRLPLIRSQHQHPERIAPPNVLTPSPPPTLPDTMPLPPPNTLQNLLNLSLHGDVQAIQDSLPHLTAENPAYQAFATQLQQFCRRFQLEAMTQWLETCLERTAL